jgi:hypothetical protein
MESCFTAKDAFQKEALPPGPIIRKVMVSERSVRHQVGLFDCVIHTTFLKFLAGDTKMHRLRCECRFGVKKDGNPNRHEFDRMVMDMVAGTTVVDRDAGIYSHVVVFLVAQKANNRIVTDIPSPWLIPAENPEREMTVILSVLMVDVEVVLLLVDPRDGFDNIGLTL